MKKGRGEKERGRRRDVTVMDATSHIFKSIYVNIL